MRRLPIYLVLDCSESMAGPAIDEVSRGVDALISALLADPLAVETAHVSLIAFARSAKQVCPLTEIVNFQRPQLRVQSGTAYGAALRLLLTCLQHDVLKSTYSTKGDYKPLVFLMTDGQPTDNWESAANALRAANNPKIANIYAIGCGEDVDVDALRRITDNVIMADTSIDVFRKMFVWLSSSIQASIKVAEPGGPSAGEAVPLPDGAQDGASWSPPSVKDPRPRQVFVRARCSRTRKPYLMRYVRQDFGDFYVPKAAHPLDDEEGDNGNGMELPPIKASLLDGCPPCPYCENPGAGLCPCGTVFCNEHDGRGAIICPSCQRELGFGRQETAGASTPPSGSEPDDFEVRPSAG
jgi:uncharacterized protein YegL